jgi:hypothetical protein
MADDYVYQLILNPQMKMPTKEADPKVFARKVQNEMNNIMSLIANPDKMITIDGQTFDKTSALGSLIINEKLANFESENTQNFSLLNAVRKSEDSLRQILG